MLLVDEAGMAKTRVLAPVLELISEAEGKAMLVGKPPGLVRALMPARRHSLLYNALHE